MLFREALRIGSKAEGIIKCTFATIYDKNGKGLFSLQRTKALRLIDTTDNTWTQVNDGVFFVDNQRKLQEAHYAGTETELHGGITIDFPLVTISEVSNERLIPARLTAEAVELIMKACENVKTAKAKYIELSRIIEERDLVYVKPLAFDWYPIAVSDKLEEARKKMENAKALLLASGGTLLF